MAIKKNSIQSVMSPSVEIAGIYQKQQLTRKTIKLQSSPSTAPCDIESWGILVNSGDTNGSQL